MMTKYKVLVPRVATHPFRKSSAFPGFYENSVLIAALSFPNVGYLLAIFPYTLDSLSSGLEFISEFLLTLNQRQAIFLVFHS
jgi:hypothetical protein